MQYNICTSKGNGLHQYKLGFFNRLFYYLFSSIDGWAGVRIFEFGSCKKKADSGIAKEGTLKRMTL